MKLVQMPTDLLRVGDDDLPALGVDARLLVAFRAYLADQPDQAGAESLAILAPSEAGSRPLLMVLARRIGAALRDRNIALRECGGDVRAGREKLCYLPGDALPQALANPPAHASLGREAACFVQDLEAAWGAGEDGRGFDTAALLGLLDRRRQRGLGSYLSAAPADLPTRLEQELRARMRVVEVG